MKHFFVINPAAGKKKRSGEIKHQIDSRMSDLGLDYEAVFTKAPMHAAELVKSAAEFSGPIRFYACGGDGTLNEVVNGAAGLAHVEVTQYPTGSGNDFIKTFGDSAERFFQLSELVDGQAHELDLIECNGRFSLNICSLGFDARIGTQMSYYKSLPLVTGAGAYVLSTIVNTIKGIHEHYEIDIDGRKFSGRYTMACICNGRYYGGGFNPVPDADLSDGLLDVLLVKKVSRLTVPAVVSKYAKGRYKELQDIITHYSAKRVEMRCVKTSPVNVDGEILMTDDAVFSVSPLKLRFVAPKGADWIKCTNEGNNMSNMAI